MKLRYGVLVLALCLAMSMALAGAEASNDAKLKDIKQMMVLAGAGDAGMQVIDGMLAIYVNQGMIDAKVAQDIANEFDADELIALTAPVYDKYFTHDDIKKLIEFYKSPIGTKMVKMQPQVMKDSMSIGEVWGREIGEKIQKRIMSEKPKDAKPAAAE